MDSYEAIRQVDGVLKRMDARLSQGRSRGARFGKDGPCLIAAVDEVTSWTIPGVKEEVERELCACLPRRYWLLSRVRPRFALAMFNDLGELPRVVHLVQRARLEFRERLVVVA